MYLQQDKLVLSATDLTDFVACRHLTALERLAAHKLAKRPFFNDPMIEILRERGLQHERAYVQHLAQLGKRALVIARESSRAVEETFLAMQEGVEVIVQARLEVDTWAGWADVLLRVDGESRFGAWRYEPVETKLAQETRASTLIQLCLYAELLADLQEAPPEWLRVVMPDSDFEPERYRFDEFRAYFRFVRRNFMAEFGRPVPASIADATPYPEPVPQCDVCEWSPVCERRWADDDHLSLVAGIHKIHRKQLERWGVTTLAALGQLPLPLPRKPSRGSSEALSKLREQARLQLEARTMGELRYELLALEPGQGVGALPPPSPLDLFLDLEGDRQAEQGGFDYLFGYAWKDADGTSRHETLWALSPDEEKTAFERLIDLVIERMSRDAGMHVYHYAPYEPTAMKRLMSRYGTRADELDQLLRSKVFVDLYSVVRKAIRAGIDSYSIKRLEPFYGLRRDIDLHEAARRLRAVEYALAKKDPESLTAEIRGTVESYNRDDCLSALRLRDWLEERRTEAERTFDISIPRPSAPVVEVKKELEERLARIRAVSDALIVGLPAERNDQEQARWVLAQLLEWHRREDKVDWWEYFRLNDKAPEDLLDERSGIGGLRFESRIETTPRGVVVDRYQFPEQDTELRTEDGTYEPGSEKPVRFATVETIDLEHRTIDLRKPAARVAQHPSALFKHTAVPNHEAAEALLRLGAFVRDQGVDVGGAHRAARDLLLRRGPRLATGVPLRLPGESAVMTARRVALALDGGVLAIQGPPGAGKTFTGARMIVDLVRVGRKIGITAVSHKVIRNLMDEVIAAAKEEGVQVRCMQRLSTKSPVPPTGIEEEADSKKGVAKILNGAYAVIGGTAWVWSKEELSGAIDVLVVDEAGQMALADVLACAQAARNLVLLGDPQQLEQPQQAAHPEGSELSALEYLLGDHETMPEELGLFLSETWRLHPSICRYTSELFYEGKLDAQPTLAQQVVSGPTIFAGTGLFYVPVAHDGNQNSSPEEAEKVAAIVKDILGPGVTWTDRKGVTTAVTLPDVLIVTPYNAQVSEIAQRIPGARVGTVDKFQGQEAPIVIYSMATSSAEEAPHGMEFLFNRHRLNVATSRARCACILVGNPRLFEPVCRTPEQMRMANAFCRYLELARPPVLENAGAMLSSDR